MKLFITVLLSISLLSSCSTLRKQQVYSALAGGVIGGIAGSFMGKRMSPDRDSTAFNKLLGGTIGATVGGMAGAGVGTLFWKRDPENTPLQKRIILRDLLQDENLEKKNEKNKPKIKLIRPKSINKIPLQSDLPKFLKGKVKKGHVLVYEIDEYQEEDEQGRIIYHEPHKAYEYTIE